MTFEGFPFIIGWELTLGCNLRCRHCGSSAGDPRIDELTLDECIALCDQFPALLVQEVNFTGGEPLLRPDWSDIASHLRQLDISTKILTNGLPLVPDVLAQLRNVGIAGIGVSLDGLETTHDYIRGYQGLYRRVIAGIARALDAGFHVTVITTVNGLNIDELPTMLQEIGRLGVDRWQLQPIFPLGRSSAAVELHLSELAYMKLGAFVHQWQDTACELGLELLPGDSFGYFTELDTRVPPWRGCPAGLFSCGITSDGKVKGCLSLPDRFVEGDLRRRDLWDIWFDPASFPYTRQYGSELLGDNCCTCALAEQCRGGCSAMSLGSSGQFHNNPYCFHGIHSRADVQPIRPALQAERESTERPMLVSAV